MMKLMVVNFCGASMQLALTFSGKKNLNFLLLYDNIINVVLKDLLRYFGEESMISIPQCSATVLKMLHGGAHLFSSLNVVSMQLPSSGNWANLKELLHLRNAFRRLTKR